MTDGLLVLVQLVMAADDDITVFELVFAVLELQRPGIL